jgi:predicted dehydrogenase
VGIFGENHARLYAQDPRTDLVGLCDLDLSRAESLAAELGVTFCTESANALLDREDVQAVSIATPDFAHTELAMMAIERGKHVLCEKPLATDAGEARRVARAAEEAGVTLMVDFHNRFNPPYLQAKAQIDEGSIGKPQLIHMRLSDTLYVPTGMLSWAGKSSVAWFLGSHCTDLIRWLTGAEVVRAYSKAGTGVLTRRGVDTPDFFVSTLELSDGTVAVVENCWILGDSAPAVVEFRAQIVGSEGHINVGVFPHQVVTVSSGDEHRALDVLAVQSSHGRLTGFAIESIRHFVDVLSGEAELLVSGQDGVEATRVVCAIEESVRVGSPVELTDAWP